MTKVAILGTRGVPANYGGFETFAEKLALGFVARGQAICVYCPAYQDYQEKYYQGIELVHIWSPEVLFENKTLRALSTIFHDLFCLIHASFQRDTVIYLLGYGAGPFLVIPRILGSRLVVNPDGIEWKSRRWSFLQRMYLLACEACSAYMPHALIVDAEPVADHFETKYGTRPAVVPYGTDIIEAVDGILPEYEERSYFLSVARMVPETSIAALIEAFIASGSKRTYVIVGPIVDPDYFTREIEPHISHPQIEFLGPIYDRDRLNSLRARAYCFLHGHASEGTSPTLLEGMASYCPVMSYGSRSNVAVLGENEAFLWHSVSDAARKIAAIDALSTEDWAACANANLTRIHERFLWERCVNEHSVLFAGLRAKRGSD